MMVDYDPIQHALDHFSFMSDNPKDLLPYLRGMRTMRLRKKFLSSPTRYLTRIVPRAAAMEWGAKKYGVYFDMTNMKDARIRQIATACREHINDYLIRQNIIKEQ